ncbi:2-oxoacid:ferredoxin oxidoreductase subunit beta [Candidatus Microgenomates bacterium]|nr:2-oxoacid:ferredoxin oxidoreductase subunit beta [Candidatus Microgenomates bacterium]
MIDTKDFEGYTPTWCPGCGDWGINAALKRAFISMKYDPSQICIAFGIGCSGNMNDFLNAYAFHGLHGRAIPTAIGIKLANHKLPVMVIAGDGDTYGEGGNHVLHLCRGNHDITLIVHDNGVYGLTTGQVAPTALHGMKSKSTPTGMIERSISPLAFLISQGATYVAQSFAADILHTQSMIEGGLKHTGLSVINVLQPCVTFNKVNTYQYYIEKSYKLEESYDPTDKPQALARAIEMDTEKFPLGVIYKEEREAYHTQVHALSAGKTLLEKDRFTAYDKLYEEYR